MQNNNGIQCRFEDIELTDQAVRFEFKDGSILQGNPERINRTDLYLWVGYMLRHVTLTEVKKGKATIYRTPAKVVADDE